MKTTSTRRTLFGPEYTFLKGILFPSLSKTVKFPSLLMDSAEGRSLFVSKSGRTSNLQSASAAFSFPFSSDIGDLVEADLVSTCVGGCVESF